MDECLWPSAQVEEYSIGADLVKLPPSRTYTIKGLHRLRNKALEVIRYGNDDDNECISAIDRYFKKNDYQIAKHTLNDNLDIPLRHNIVEWISEASDYDIESFCTWSLQRTVQLSRSLLRDKNILVDHTLSKTEELTKIGLFPPIALPVIRSATDRYYLQGIDSFHSGGSHCIAFCGQHRIGVANLYNNASSLTGPSKSMYRTLFHEYIHGGGNDRGFFKGITDQNYVRIIEEAFVEHATVVAHTPFVKQPRIIHPKKRLHTLDASNSTYATERTFLAVTCDHTDISVEHLSEAYFTPRGDERGERLRTDIERKIGKFFGSREGFYQFVNAYETSESNRRDNLVHDTIKHLQKR